MKKYIALKLLSLFAGVVLLSDKQAKSRSLVLNSLKKKGQYEIIGECWFKAGEEFGFDGEIPKTLAGDLEEIKKTKAAEKKEALKQADDLVKNTANQLAQLESELELSEEELITIKAQVLDAAGGNEEAISDEQKVVIEAAENLVTERTNAVEMAQEALISAEEQLNILI